MVSWCTWNVRGLNSPIKCRAVKDFLPVSTVGFCCILETRVREENFVSISRRFVIRGGSLVTTAIVEQVECGLCGNVTDSCS